MTPEYLIHMMDVLAQYEEAYDPKQPQINLDEKLYQLKTTPRGTQPPRPGSPGQKSRSGRVDYEYKRQGAVNIFVCVELKTGQRHLRVTNRRTKKDFARFVRYLVMERYKRAEKVHITLDQLNTHIDGSVLEQYGEVEGRKILDRLQWHYTPKHASWLNAVEIEIGVLEKQVLKQRLGSKKELIKHTLAYQRRRNKDKATIDWQFTRDKARDKFKLHDKCKLHYD